jgi:1,4-alpha-glucan branching enzyme
LPQRDEFLSARDAAERAAAAAPAGGDIRMQIDALLRGEHDNPFYLLGMHREPPDEEVVVRTFQPHASHVWVIDSASGEVVAELERVHPAGFFAGRTGRSERFRYRLRRDAAGRTVEFEDPYRFPPVLGELDLYLWAEGRHLRAYEKLGAHAREIEGVAGVAFAVWAPNARRVSVVGPFNNWDGRCHPMRRRVEGGVWEIFIPGLAPGEIYKYEIKGAAGELLPLKADPFALQCERPPNTASIVGQLGEGYRWRDEPWMTSRARANARSAPISIYECHLGSWARVPEEGGRPLRYAELGERLVSYVKDMGFTHVELLPISEYPFDGSWGYQPIGLFAPTSRFGTPDDCRALLDRFHEAGIGVLLDWVPGHFPTDAHGLAHFDGTALYEHADPRQGFHHDWNTLIFNYGRNEVANFLIASALFWLDRYHLDGLRVDAVASMLYLDYSRKAGEWVPNRYGGNENIEATAFLRRMNELVFAEHEGATTVAEESTAWPAVSRPTYVGGLGFGYKWNMGWMHDTLRYMSRDPIYRRFHHHDLTFGLLYAFSENFVLPLSHDEVVHGKGSLLGRMPGDRWQKFANLRAYFGFMFAHPGKKLLFMGGEFGQEREWNHDSSLDWHLLNDASHRGVQDLVRDLNHLYRGSPAMHELDCEPQGFEWIEASDSDNCVLSFLRRDRTGERVVIAVCNFTPMVRQGYRLGVPKPGRYLERINTDSQVYGGSNVGNAGGVAAGPTPSHGRPHSIEITLPPLATVIFEWCP